MFLPGIVVFEQGSRWEAGLKRGLAKSGAASCDLTIRPCRILADVLAAWSRAPGSVTVVDLSYEPETGLRLIRQARDQTPNPPVIALLAPRQSDLEWPLRELGSLSLWSTESSPEALADHCLRILQGPRQTLNTT